MNYRQWIKTKKKIEKWKPEGQTSKDWNFIRDILGYICLEECDGKCCQVFFGIVKTGETTEEAFKRYCEKYPKKHTKRIKKWFLEDIKVLTAKEAFATGVMEEDNKQKNAETYEKDHKEGKFDNFTWFTSCRLFDKNRNMCSDYNNRPAACRLFPTMYSDYEDMVYKNKCPLLKKMKIIFNMLEGLEILRYANEEIK